MQRLSYLTWGILPGLSLCFCSVSGFLPCALGLNLFCNLGLECSLYSLWFLIQHVRLHYLLADFNWACPLGSQIWSAGRVFLPGPGIWQVPLVRSWCACCSGIPSGICGQVLRMVCAAGSTQILLVPSAVPGLPLGQSYLQVPVALSLNLSLLHSFSTSPLLESPPHPPSPRDPIPPPFLSTLHPSASPFSPLPSAALPSLPSSFCLLSSFFSVSLPLPISYL